MTSSHDIEAAAFPILEAWLTDHGRSFERQSRKSTFDYIVDDVKCEMKATTGSDILALTGPQYDMLVAGELGAVFSVNIKTNEVIEIPRDSLLKIEPKVYSTYEWSVRRFYIESR